MELDTNNEKAGGRAGVRAPRGKRQKLKLGNTVKEEPVGNERHNRGGTKSKGNGELNLINNRKAPKKTQLF